MARNVEIKARLGDLEATRRLVGTLADGPPQSLQQTDTFFRIDGGRLKLRELSGAGAELIYYRRPDTPEPVESEYEKVAVADATALRELLASALGIRGQVHKRRLVYRIGRTRVHLDDVRDLGAFLELEVELAEAEPADAGVREAHVLLGALHVPRDALVSEAYIDLLSRRDA